ncbi:MAG: hypothetical protein LH473_01360 [Chitinophagales bacterium]|nr:hypothetical protein [Chitinophagales bacterium]
MSRSTSLLHYFHAPLLKEKTSDHLILESIRNKVWNPVFTMGAITFFLSMMLRGFFDQAFAVIPLGLSTIVLFSGIWILSANAVVIFDKKQSEVLFIYKHLGYLQKIYMHPISSIEEITLTKLSSGKYRFQFLKDDGNSVKIAETKNIELLMQTAKEVAAFLNIPLKIN